MLNESMPGMATPLAGIWCRPLIETISSIPPATAAAASGQKASAPCEPSEIAAYRSVPGLLVASNSLNPCPPEAS